MNWWQSMYNPVSNFAQGVGNAGSGLLQGATNQLNNLGEWASSWGNVNPTTTQAISPIGTGGYDLGTINNAQSVAKPEFFSMDSFLGTEGNSGWGGSALGALQGMGNWYSGMQAQKLAKEQFAFNKQMAEKNLANQTKTLNTAMADRQNARRAASSSYQDTASYMDENRI